MSERTQKIDDSLFRWTGIPLTGIIAFHLSGFSKELVQFDERIINYFFFTLISFCLWTGSALAHYLARHHLAQVRKIYFRLPARFGLTIAISWLLSFIAQKRNN